MTDQFFGLTDPGKQRQNNEDTFITQQSASNRFIIACVIDGVGGYAGGEIAAALAREAILKRLQDPSGEIPALLIDCFAQANERIIQEKQHKKEYEQMSCVSTLAIVDIANNQFYYAHVGDTRLYLLRDQSLVKISHDQSFVGFLEESGRLSEDEAMSHPKRNEISKALGFETQLEKNSDYIETGQSPFLPGDLLLLCSDGLTDMVSSKEITGILLNSSSLKDKAGLLINAANSNGGKDNVTVVLVQNDKVSHQHAATPVKQREQVTNTTSSHVTIKSVEDASLEPTPKSKTGLIAILVILMLLFLASSVYLYLKDQATVISPTSKPSVVVSKMLDSQRVKLQSAINNAKGKVFVIADTAYKSPIIIHNAILIDKDTLLIKAKGHIVFQADSGYSGAAIVVSSRCKSVVLDSVSFINFNIAISITNNSLELKNVQFVNCKQSVQNEFALTDKKYISGKFTPIIFRADSIPVKHK